MSIKASCPRCNATWRIQSGLEGRTVYCPECTHGFTIHGQGTNAPDFRATSLRRGAIFAITGGVLIVLLVVLLLKTFRVAPDYNPFELDDIREKLASVNK